MFLYMMSFFSFSKKSFIVFLKLALAFALLFWMISKGKLDLSSASILVEKPTLLISGVGLWFLASVLSNSIRWRLLVEAIGVKLSVLQSLRVTLVGLFFNTFLPGSVGGDLVKALYVYRFYPDKSDKNHRMTAMLTIVLDRVLGLSSLFIMVLPIFWWRRAMVLDSPMFTSMSAMTVAGACVMVLFLSSLLVSWPQGKDPLRWVFSFRFVGSHFLLRIYDSLRVYKTSPLVLLRGILLSVCSQCMLILILYLVTRQMSLAGQQQVHFLDVALIVPLGCLITALPISPGGIGVGHIAFAGLFELIGIHEGANIYNVFFLIVTVPNLLGLIPYLTMDHEFMKDKQTVLET